MMKILATLLILSLLLVQARQSKPTKVGRQKKSLQENNVNEDKGELARKYWISVLGKSRGSTTVSPKKTTAAATTSQLSGVSKRRMKRIISDFNKKVLKLALDTSSAKYSAHPRRLAAVHLPLDAIPNAVSAFTVTLQNNILIPKRRFTFLSGFDKGMPGTFIRGSGLDLRLGRYTVPFTAFYRFHVNINIHRPLKGQSSKVNDGVTARLCIDGECYKNLMKFRMDTSSNAKSTSMNFSGHLYLQKHQYIEIVVENSLTTRILITSSMFSGYLLGS